MKKLLPLVFLPLLFTSCVFIPEKDTAKNEQKTSYKSFESLNEPLILNYRNVLDFSLYGNKNFATSKINQGSILAIYDWESGTIYDYVYAPGIYGNQSTTKILPGLKTDGKLKFYSTDLDYDVAYCLDASKTELEKIDLSENCFQNEAKWGNPESVTSDYALRYFCKDFNEDTSSEEIKIHILNGKENKFNDEITVDVDSFYNMECPFYDSDGCFWYSYTTSEDENHKTYNKIKKINITENKIEDTFVSFDCQEGQTYDETEGWSNSLDYELKAVNSDSLLVSKKFETNDSGNTNINLLTINKSDKTEKSYELKPAEDTTYYLENVLTINDDFYLLCCNYVSEKNLFHIFKLDSENGTLSAELNGTEISGSYTVASRDTKIFFASYDTENESYSILYFDTKDNSVSESKTFALSDFAD